MTAFVVEQSEKLCSRCRLTKARAGGSWCVGCHAGWMRDNRKLHSQLTDEQRKKANCRAYTKMLQRRGQARVGPCEVCGDPDATNHHDDYNDPRTFRRLCRKHHREADAAKKQRDGH